VTHSVFPSKKGVFLADFHIHSHFSRATSPDMHPSITNRVAKQKGLSVIGTGDFTHPGYLEELKEELEPEGTGLYVCKDDPDGTKFILTSEVSNIFTQGGKSRRIHTVFFAPDFQVVEEIQDRVGSIGNISSDGRPILGFPVKELVRIIMEVSSDCFVLPAHIWTPWFSLFGAKSGFDTLEECFEEQSKHIFALETGLSSDPQMNWRLSALDKYTLLSNSDAHSPPKLAREANCFSCEPTYEAITAAIKDPGCGFEGTIEFFPEEGKYHYDGHRACGICMKPQETIKHKGKCPVCGQNLTVGSTSDRGAC
jgi:PHP family Zn ribbon phosphoesterase